MSLVDLGQLLLLLGPQLCSFELGPVASGHVPVSPGFSEGPWALSGCLWAQLGAHQLLTYV